MSNSAISLKEAVALESILKSVANRRRLQILSVILNKGEASVGDIDNAIPDLKQSPISQHLAVLREKGVVKFRKEHQSRIYSIASHEVIDLIEGFIFSLSKQEGELDEAREVFRHTAS